MFSVAEVPPSVTYYFEDEFGNPVGIDQDYTIFYGGIDNVVTSVSGEYTFTTVCGVSWFTNIKWFTIQLTTYIQDTVNYVGHVNDCTDSIADEALLDTNAASSSAVVTVSELIQYIS